MSSSTFMRILRGPQGHKILDAWQKYVFRRNPERLIRYATFARNGPRKAAMWGPTALLTAGWLIWPAIDDEVKPLWLGGKLPEE